MGIKRKLYETIARHLKGGAWGKGREGQGMGSRSRMYTCGEQRVYVWWAKGIRLVMKTYTFRSQNVYVSSVKRIRFRHETYTSWTGAEFASSGHGA